MCVLCGIHFKSVHCAAFTSGKPTSKLWYDIDEEGHGRQERRKFCQDWQGLLHICNMFLVDIVDSDFAVLLEECQGEGCYMILGDIADYAFQMRQHLLLSSCQ